MNLVSKKDHNQCKISYMREKYLFCKIKSLYTISNLCVVIELIARYFPYGLKFMSRNTLSELQSDSASYAFFVEHIAFNRQSKTVHLGHKNTI